ncbi:MAG: hypothetical protein CME62_09485 [Halobacteriovoraceae bacterium]|nr:hypothetical protein [Halobacteriovoraceae bacterium]|tara:strand:- start:2051 stop:2434 length:384 start_codon:yes stop_codon:yes gene_type:complete
MKAKREKELKKHILLNEINYLKALLSGDCETVLELSHFPCTLANAYGVQIVDRHQLRKHCEDYKHSLEGELKFMSAKVELLNHGTAIVSYQTTYGGVTMVDVSTWVESEDGWRCAFHSEHPVVKYKL